MSAIAGKLPAASTDEQLRFLESEIQDTRKKVGDGGRRAWLLLSLAESVKSARDHDLNCPKEKRHD